MFTRRNDIVSAKRFQRKRIDNVNNDNALINKHRKTEIIADRLVEVFNNPDWRPFYCKVAYKLSEARIWNNVERAQAAKSGNPARLFTHLCKIDGV